MHSNDTIQNELKELNSMLVGFSNKNVYTVPDGYFDVLSHDILLSIQQPAIREVDNSSVPTGYFDGLADTIMGKIKADEEGSSLLAGIKDIHVYRVPPGYFDNLAARIVDKLHQPAKVVVMERRSSFFRYAAAAVITGIIGLSVISVFDKKQTENTLASTGITAAVLKDANRIIDNNSFDEELSKVADDDIVNYLKENGEDVTTALVASVADDRNLPDQVDYITDDKTLDNLLNELKAGESTNN